MAKIDSVITATSVPPPAGEVRSGPGPAAASRAGDNGDLAPPARPPFRRTRWTVALLIVVLAAGLTIAGLAKGMRPACQVTTVTNTAGSPGGTTTTKVCGMLDVTDYIYVLAIVGVLLLPDMKSLKIGGLEFERLTTEVAKQTSEIGQLRVEVSNVASNTNSIRIQVGEVARLAFADWRTHFRKQIDVLRRTVGCCRKIRRLRPISKRSTASRNASMPRTWIQWNYGKRCRSPIGWSRACSRPRELQATTWPTRGTPGMCCTICSAAALGVRSRAAVSGIVDRTFKGRLQRWIQSQTP